MYEDFADKIIDHISSGGCDDVFSKPFFASRWDEELLTKEDWRAFFRTQISAAITQNPVHVGSLCYIAIPKSRYSFRAIARVSLIDTLKYTALVFKVGKDIEAARLPKSVVFSNRFDATSLTLDRSNFDNFRLTSKYLSESKEYKIKIITDISNFYDRISIHKLENIMREINADSVIVDKINKILIHWSRQQSFGIPVGSDASRLLAEAMLINADRELSSHDIKFVRYVDDYRIFCKSPGQAYEAMHLLDAALRQEGLFLNSGKTKLIDLTHGHVEPDGDKVEFEPIDPEEKIEQTKLVRGRYSVRIAKFYRFPGKEAIDRFRQLDLASELAKASNPNVTEEALKDFIKASIYAVQPDFSWLSQILEIYPHLIPYVVDAIVKESENNNERFDEAFRSKAIDELRSIYLKFPRIDYFRIQAVRLLCQIDPNCDDFLSKELLKLKGSEEILFSQIVQFLGSKMPRGRFLELLGHYGSYGPCSKASLAFALKRGLVLTGDERSANIKNLSHGELDSFLKQVLRTDS